MKYFASLALLLFLALPAVYAQQEPVKMTFSGTAANSAINLQQPDSSMDEDNFAGRGSLGSFTVRNIRSLPNSPSPSDTCSGSNLLHFTESVGGSIIRFGDGSLLYLNITNGDDCIDLSSGVAQCVLTLQISGGTGRFKNASGTLTMTETARPVLSDFFGNPALFAATGEVSGTISGVSEPQAPNEAQ
ncbi:MAG TPA: hypothetical protein VJN93_13490 [Candidatus Acidoferrum sp.]|nr:hypothetical protein [Candidatus Acidoferrum sp.]